MTLTARQKKLRKKERDTARRAREGICPHPAKAFYPTKHIAEDALYTAWAARGLDKYPIRVYRCECKSWHLTSIPLDHIRTP